MSPVVLAVLVTAKFAGVAPVPMPSRCRSRRWCWPCRCSRWPGQLALVTVVAEVVKVPEATVPVGGVKVTVTPETGLLYWSVTVAPSGLVKAVATTALAGPRGGRDRVGRTGEVGLWERC